MNLKAKTSIKEKAEKYIKKFECYNPFYFKYKFRVLVEFWLLFLNSNLKSNSI